eukprot:1221852-Prorocentrum_lima.AAC.1
MLSITCLYPSHTPAGLRSSFALLFHVGFVAQGSRERALVRVHGNFDAHPLPVRRSRKSSRGC